MAYVQPIVGSPTTFSAGTRAFSNQVSQNARVLPVVRNGFARTPGVFMSTRKKPMPFCFLGPASVRARTKIQSANCAYVVHVFCPLTTKLPLPSSSARHWSEARSLPALGSE